ncbi:MAG TPA: hypothetical protein PLB90_11295 [Opitutaceae bacterium]|nr:hypothetical protein [Opitutaceae bacterium]
MKVALLSESPADEAVLRELVGAVLREPPRFTPAGLRARGWPNVAQVLPAVIRHLHFNTDTDTLVVTVDSDDSVVHVAAHDAPNYFHPQCRLCQLRAVFRQTTKKLPPAHGRARVLRCVGVAVPALEAWLLCGRDPAVSEAAWVEGLASGRRPYTRAELKFRVYGTDRPTLPYEIQRATEEIRRHRADPRRLENDFPGFGAMARDLRENREMMARGEHQHR